MKAKPFLKWAGGKTKLAPIIASHMPERIGQYRDRFCGACGMYFHLANERRFESAEISDKNPEIVNALRALEWRPDYVYEEIIGMTAGGVTAERFSVTRQAGFLGVAHEQTRSAARTIVLNKYGFNGLYRLNRKGEFNVGWGKKEHVNIELTDLHAACVALRRAVFIDVIDALEPDLDLDLVPGDVCYYDPPYIPKSKTSSFTAYDGHPFTLDDQRRLAKKALDVSANGATVIVSNSATDEARAIFGTMPGCETFELSRQGTMNCNGKKRSRVDELLFVLNGRKQ